MFWKHAQDRGWEHWATGVVCSAVVVGAPVVLARDDAPLDKHVHVVRQPRLSVAHTIIRELSQAHEAGGEQDGAVDTVLGRAVATTVVVAAVVAEVVIVVVVAAAVVETAIVVEEAVVSPEQKQNGQPSESWVRTSEVPGRQRHELSGGHCEVTIISIDNRIRNWSVIFEDLCLDENEICFSRKRKLLRCRSATFFARIPVQLVRNFEIP